MRTIIITGSFFVFASLATVAHGQQLPETEADRQEAVSIRFGVWSKRYRGLSEDGFGLRAKLQLSGSVYRFRTIDELSNRDREVINSIGVRPSVEFELATPVENVRFIPSFDLAFNEALETGNRLLSGAVEGGFIHRIGGDPDDIESRIGLKYGSDYELDGLNFDDYLELNLRVRFRNLGIYESSKRRYVARPFVEISRFVDDIEFRLEDGTLFDVDTTAELGLSFGTDPRFRIFGIKAPEIRISYVFGGDFRGVRIRL